MNEAAILAARRSLKEISKEEIADALERIIAGPEKKGAVMSDKKRKLVAYHEVRGRGVWGEGRGCGGVGGCLWRVGRKRCWRQWSGQSCGGHRVGQRASKGSKGGDMPVVWCWLLPAGCLRNSS